MASSLSAVPKPKLRTKLRTDIFWAILLLLGVIQLQLRSVAAYPRFIEPAEGDRTGNVDLELARSPASVPQQQQQRRSSNSNTLVNVPEALKKFRFNDGGLASQGDNVERVGGLPDAQGTIPEPVKAGIEGTRASEQLAEIALIVTVDGAIHAIRRDTGLWIWSLHDDNPTAQRQDVIRSPLVRSSSHGSSNGQAQSTTSNLTSNSSSNSNDGEDDEIYIIEPHSAGDIYVFHKATNKLQKLPLSVSQLVDLSPFTFPHDNNVANDAGASADGKLFVGRKETKLVGVDLQTGRLVGVFGPEAGWCEWQTLRRSTSFSSGRSDSVIGDDGIENRPWDLLYLGRTDYHISIYSKTQGLLQTLQYTSYGPSSLTAPGRTNSATNPPPVTEESSWLSSPDGRYIQPMHDGSLVCFHADTDGLQWTNQFSQPVIGVFDVVFPASSSSSGPVSDTSYSEEEGRKAKGQPLLYPHPSQSFHSALAGLGNLPSSTFIGKIKSFSDTDGAGSEYFAMSNANYPLIAFAPSSSPSIGAGRPINLEDDPETGDGESERRIRGKEERMLGSHRVEEPIDSGKTIDPAPEPPLGIDPPPISPASPDSNSRPSQSGRIDGFPDQRGIESGAGVLDRFRLGQSSELPTLETIIMLLGCLVLGFTYLRKRLAKKEEPKTIAGKANLSLALPSKEATPSDIEQSTSKDDAVSTSLTEKPSSGSVPRRNGHTPSPSTEKALPALPVDYDVASRASDQVEAAAIVSLEDNSDKEDEGFENGSDPKEGNGKNPKKGRRRKRGRRPGQTQGQIHEQKLGLSEIGEDGNEDMRVDGEENKVKIVTTPPTLEKDADVAGRVGNLTVSDNIIGYGSHGTVVLKGTFQGRAVAVKRLLKDFVTVASHEVQLLQESDSHSNVIRYFCKEQHENFLYIALELCPASLFELIDMPNSFPELVKAFDPIKALKQITRGLQHLHKLKIIHRDMKPQNILIAATPAAPVSSKSQPVGAEAPKANIRMVISDFGLCKKLDLDESSFLQSTRGGGNHAPGSFGYRAPEVLRGEVDANDLVNNNTDQVQNGPDSTTSSSTTSTSTLAPTSKSSSNGNGQGRKLTRSIDIFSLGCIFYFVLTMGDHPFGSRYEREVNILNDKISLDGLSVMTENVYEAQQLVRSMCSGDPYQRPTATEIMLNPLFWSSAKSLHFLCDASDRFEIFDKDAPAVLDLEANAADIVGTDWLRQSLDRNLVDNLGKYRKYDGGSVRDLMRVLRNKKHHYQDLPDNVRRSLGEPPAGFLSYFTKRFPKLLLHVHSVVKLHLVHERMFSTYFELSDEG